MGLDYRTQIPAILIGSKTSAGVTTGVTLESTYQNESDTVATKTFDVGGHSRVDFAITYVMGATESSNSIEMKVEWSPELVNFYQLANDSTSGGTSTLTAREWTFVGTNAGTAKITVGIDISYKEALRVSFKETGVSSNKGTLYCEALLSGR